MCTNKEVIENGTCIYMPQKGSECLLFYCAFDEEDEEYRSEDGSFDFPEDFELPQESEQPSSFEQEE